MAPKKTPAASSAPAAPAATPATEDPGAGLANFLLAGLVLIPAFILSPWILFQLKAPHGLPPAWFRPSLGADSHVCQNLDVSAPDPYGRAPSFGDAPFQKMEFCEAVDPVGDTGRVIISCDQGRGEWNTVMGPLTNPSPRGGLWIYDYVSAAASTQSGSPSAVQPQLLPLVDFPDRYDFHPLGTATWEEVGPDGKEEVTLFVVNHARLLTSVEVFALEQTGSADKWQARYLRSVVHPLATHSGNALVATSKTSFIITNDHLFPRRPSPLSLLTQTLEPVFGSFAPSIASLISTPRAAEVLPMIETVLGLPLSWLTHVVFDAAVGRVPVPNPSEDAFAASAEVADKTETQHLVDATVASQGVQARVLDRWISFSNGVAISPNGTTLAVASSLYPGVRLYAVAKNQDGSFDAEAEKPIALSAKFHTPMGADNVLFTKPYQALGGEDVFDGAALVVGGHPSGLGLMKQARNPRDVASSAPSWIVSVTPSSRRPYDEKEDLQKQQTARDGAPYPVTKRLLSQNRRWNMRTLYQSEGRPIEVVSVDEAGNQLGKRKVGTSSSSGALWDPTLDGKGSLIVTGLYGGVTSCLDVGRGEQ